MAAPIRSESAAILSSGTWSLLGLELDAPVLTDQAREFNLTNERGVDGTIRLLRNVMGLWLVQECRRCWGDPSYDELQEQAAAARADVPLFDPDDERFLRAGRHARADRRRVRRAGPAAAGGPGRDRPLRARLARLQVPARARAARARRRASTSRSCT